MPVFEQGYRRYVGEKSTSSRALAIAWANVRTRIRWWLWVILFFLLFQYIIYAVMIFVVTLGQGLTGSTTTPLHFQAVAFENTGPNPAVLLGRLQGDSLSIFWDLLHLSTFSAFVVPALLGSGLLASDRRTGALQIYFARPVSRWDYFVAKVTAAASFVAMATAVPSLLIWGETVAFGSASGFTWRTWVAPFAIVGGSAFYALWSVSLVLFCSSLMRRPAIAAVAAIGTFLLLEGISGILSEALRDHGLGRGWRVIAPTYAIGATTAPLFGMDVPTWINSPVAFGVALGVPAVLLWVVWRRLKAVEVAT